MSSGFEFDEGMVESLERVYRTDSIVRRRAFVREKLAPDPGEAVLSVGAGPGFEPLGLSRAVGTNGRVLGVDASPSMLAVARERCADRPQVSFSTGEATSLPVDDASFGKATAVQVLEYVDDVEAAVAELRRVLAPGGRAVVFDSDFDTLVYGAEDSRRSRRVLRAYDAHCAHPRIATTLRATLERAGFHVAEIVPHTHCETSPDGVGGELVDEIGAFVGARTDLPDDEVEAWLADVEARAEAGEFFFSFTQYAFVAEKPQA